MVTYPRRRQGHQGERNPTRATARVAPTIHVYRFTVVKRWWEPSRSIVGTTLAVVLEMVTVVLETVMVAIFV